MLTFSQLLVSAQRADGALTVNVSDGWLQGRSLFGGLQAALALEAMRAVYAGGAPLRTLQVSFMAPVPPGEVRVQAQLLRSGKSTSHVQAQIVDGAQVLCTAIGIFGTARESPVKLAPAWAAVDGKPREFPYVPGVTPSFTQHFSVRWLRGGMPFTGATQPENVIEIDMRDGGYASEAHVLAIADFIPPLALSLLKKPAFGSSMTWMIEFLADPSGLPLQGWRMDAEMTAAGEGYTSQTGLLWGPDRRAVALSRQSMVVFA